MKSTYELPRLTRCPKCQTTFRVSNEQLRVAGGKVRCGHCDNVFNALFSLVAETPAEAEETTPVQTEPDSQPEAAPHILADEQNEADTAVTAIETEALPDAETLVDEVNVVEEAGQPDEAEFAEAIDTGEEIEYIELSGGDLRMESPFDEEAQQELAPESEPAAESEDEITPDEAGAEIVDEEPPPVDTSIAEQPEYDESIEKIVEVSDEDRQMLEDSIPFAIRESVLAAGKPAMSRTQLALLSVLALVLVVTLAIQLAVFRGFQMGQQFPSLRPFINLVCDYAGCSYTGPSDVKQIHLLNRDIRGIPDRPGVLLITATMRNNAAFRQPFPDFEIVLSDLTGNVVAQRRFSPAEYLGTLGREQLLMDSRTPVQVQLEVLDPGADAVNFEINFY